MGAVRRSQGWCPNNDQKSTRHRRECYPTVFGVLKGNCICCTLLHCQDETVVKTVDTYCIQNIYVCVNKISASFFWEFVGVAAVGLPSERYLTFRVSLWQGTGQIGFASQDVRGRRTCVCYPLHAILRTEPLIQLALPRLKKHSSMDRCYRMKR